MQRAALVPVEQGLASLVVTACLEGQDPPRHDLCAVRTRLVFGVEQRECGIGIPSRHVRVGAPQHVVPLMTGGYSTNFYFQWGISDSGWKFSNRGRLRLRERHDSHDREACSPARVGLFSFRFRHVDGVASY